MKSFLRSATSVTKRKNIDGTRLETHWKSKGLTVIPTVSWGLTQSFDFCFDGIEKNATVAIGMIGCKRNKLPFMRGYNAMLEKLEPSKIICFGTPFAEMDGNIVTVDYSESRKVVR